MNCNTKRLREYKIVNLLQLYSKFSKPKNGFEMRNKNSNETINPFNTKPWLKGSAIFMPIVKECMVRNQIIVAY